MPAVTVFASAMGLATSLALLVLLVRDDLRTQDVRPILSVAIWLVAILVVAMAYAYLIEPRGIYECHFERRHGYAQHWSCR